MTKMLRLEEGKRYIRRDSLISNPVVKTDVESAVFPWVCDGRTYTNYGRRFFNLEDPLDLIEEYIPMVDAGDGYRIYDQKVEGLKCPENLEIRLSEKNWQYRPVSAGQLCKISTYRVPIVLDIDPEWRILDKTEPLMAGDQINGTQAHTWMYICRQDIDYNNKIEGCRYRRRIKCETLMEKLIEEERVEAQELGQLNPLEDSPVDVQFITMPKEKIVKNVAKFIGSWALRGLNYWVTEPAMNIVKRIMWSVRYVTLTTMIAGCIYGYNYPDHLKSFLSSCLPKITIEAPEIMR